MKAHRTVSLPALPGRAGWSADRFGPGARGGIARIGCVGQNTRLRRQTGSISGGPAVIDRFAVMDTGGADRFGYSLGCIGTCRTAVALSGLNQTPRTAQSAAELTLSVLSTGDSGDSGATDQIATRVGRELRQRDSGSRAR